MQELVKEWSGHVEEDYSFRDTGKDPATDFTEPNSITVALAPSSDDDFIAIFNEGARNSIAESTGFFPFQLSSNKLPRESGVAPLMVPEPMRSPVCVLQPEIV